MKIENVKNMRVLVADSGYLTQNTDEEIDNRIFVKEKILLDFERLEDYKEVNEMPVIDNEQIIWIPERGTFN